MPHTANDPTRSLVTLQRLLEIPAADMKSALTHATNALAEVLAADKVDAFLYEEERDTLVAVGTSTQPLSNLQKRLGLDVLPQSNGGRVVDVYRTGNVYFSGNVLVDADELRGVKEGLRIQSEIGIPLEVGGTRRGMVMIASLQPDHFTERDEAFARSAVKWVGMVVHRAELITDIERNALAQGRRMAAEELITVLAHDIRNYIAPVSGRLFALRHRAESEGRAADLEDVNVAVRGVNRLTGLVGNLLDMARLDRGLFDLDIEPVDLVALTREAAATLSTPDHRIVVNASDGVVVAGDPARLRQCVDNLLANALNHSPRNAPVTALLSLVDMHGAPFGQLEIIDEGPGIPEEVLPKMFERFVTGRGREGGLGLGLYLAKRIATAHGGDVIARQAAERGACFVVRLPLYQARDPGPA